ncbi:hypothetical protein B0H11DRAFT_1911582 [Mycena galericulata]|nr:hypothetical protein B0H11DRAFT_1911582 [Mycena galericulata]
MPASPHGNSRFPRVRNYFPRLCLFEAGAYGGPDAHLFPPRKHLTTPRKLAFFGRPARDFASLIPSTSFARTACSAPRDFGPTRAKIQTSARAQNFLRCTPQRNSLDEQRFEIQFMISNYAKKPSTAGRPVSSWVRLDKSMGWEWDGGIAIHPVDSGRQRIRVLSCGLRAKNERECKNKFTP